jgi:hypothetical protein
VQIRPRRQTEERPQPPRRGIEHSRWLPLDRFQRRERPDPIRLAQGWFNSSHESTARGHLRPAATTEATAKEAGGLGRETGLGTLASCLQSGAPECFFIDSPMARRRCC